MLDISFQQLVVIVMSYCFKGCINLREMPKLPNGLQTLIHTFQDCDSLAKFTPIPASVTNISYFMYNASNTPTSIEINCNPTTYEKAIDLTRITTIKGSCNETTKANILATKPQNFKDKRIYTFQNVWIFC